MLKKSRGCWELIFFNTPMTGVCVLDQKYIFIESSIIFLIFCIFVYDLSQKKHAILRNFPIIGHLRFLLEKVGPELRQYIVTNNNEERPFSRDQRRWIYASSKKENDEFGFGTDEDLETSENILIIKQAGFAFDDRTGKDFSALGYPIPCAKILGKARGREKAFRPNSVVNISGMSFGSLSGRAVEALNIGAKLAQCYQSTGEGGISPYHSKGGDLVWNIGSGYFGCRDSDGRFSLSKFRDTVNKYKVKAIEIKLSQGAKPGLGGVLPGKKVTREIANTRGVPLGKACLSPSRHSAFSNIDELIDFVELLASETGLPIGIKSAVGDLSFWTELCEKMTVTGRGVDFVTIDGGEGGTGAAPLVFTDHVSLPFKLAFTSVYKEFARQGLHKKVVFIGSGKLGLPENALFALSMGADIINVGREALLAIGCIQAQKCHTNHCPTGVTTQSKWLARGLDPTLKAVRAANYIKVLRKEIIRLTWACGVSHPALIRPNQLAIIDGYFHSKSPQTIFQYEETWGLPSTEDICLIEKIMRQRSF
jgi:glutamate synthase domain-containing protein 2